MTAEGQIDLLKTTEGYNQKQQNKKESLIRATANWKDSLADNDADVHEDMEQEI